MADTLITPINDSLVDLDVLVAMEQSDLEPQPSAYAKAVWRALEARRKVSGRTTDWIVVRNRLESVESSNQHQITQVLDVIQRTVGFRVARGLLERSRVFSRRFDGARPDRRVRECRGTRAP